MSTVTATQARATWKIDPAHSQAEFAVRHLMITTVRGRFTDVSGVVVTDDADPTKAEVEVTINSASIDTREAQRDAHLKSADFFDVQQFPAITFKSTRVTGVRGDQFELAG